MVRRRRQKGRLRPQFFPLVVEPRPPPVKKAASPLRSRRPISAPCQLIALAAATTIAACAPNRAEPHAAVLIFRILRESLVEVAGCLPESRPPVAAKWVEREENARRHCRVIR